jgi:hypothetical protein
MTGGNMSNSAFPMLIMYTDTDETQVVRSSDEVTAGRTFIILDTQCPLVQWPWFVAGMAVAIIFLGGYYFWLWG